METVDILIAVFAVIAVVGSVAGAALYEPPEGGVTWQVAFSESETETLQSEDESKPVSDPTGSPTAEFVLSHNVSAVGVTELKFDVTLGSDRALARAGAGATYEAYLMAPDGERLDVGDAGSSGSFDRSASFTLTVPETYLAEVPEDRTVQAANISGARQAVNETLPTNATGVWEVHIHITFSQGSALVAENVEAESTPKLKRVVAEVGTDLGPIFTGA